MTEVDINRADAARGSGLGDRPPESRAPRAVKRRSLARRIFQRGPWENGAVAMIAAGVVSLMQPFSIWLFGNSFSLILIGTVGFVIVSHFPDDRDG